MEKVFKYIPIVLQGLLSTTYIVDVQYSYEGTEDTKSIFVKIPLNKDGEATYHEVFPY